MTARPRRGGRGFTLLEVMVALGILAGALLAISEVVSGALRNHARADRLEVATLLARGKMVELRDRFETEGFAPTEQSDEGTFEDDGHPEVRWRVEVSVPTTPDTSDGLVQLLTHKDLKDLLPSPDQAPQLAVQQAQLGAALQTVLARLAEEMKRGLRRVRLTVSWPEDGRRESFDVTTDMVVLQASGGQR